MSGSLVIIEYEFIVEFIVQHGIKVCRTRTRDYMYMRQFILFYILNLFPPNVGQFAPTY